MSTDFIDSRRAINFLKKDGIYLLGQILPGHTIDRMKLVYSRALEKPTWNTWIGFEQNEKWRRLIENVLLYDKSFLDLPLREELSAILAEYIGPKFELTEARGWETVATKRNFHGWHQDAWCREDLVPRPREIKLACYLTDVTSGQFQYIAGTHQRTGPARMYSAREIEPLADRIVDVKGEAGTCFLFDTSGIHRQSTPVLEKRWVLFYNFHDPATPLGDFATGYSRYRPQMLNACFLGGLTHEQQRILGFYRKNEEVFHPEEQRYPLTHAIVGLITKLRLENQDYSSQVRRIIDAVQRRLSR